MIRPNKRGMFKFNRRKENRLYGRCQFILDEMADAFFMFDIEGNIVESNKKFSQLVKYNRDELAGLNYKKLDPHSTLNLNRVWSQLREIQDTKYIETNFISKDKKSIHVEVKLGVLEEDSTRFFVAFVRDISIRAIQQRTLQLTQYAVDHAANPTFWYKTEDPIFLYVNDAACEYLGYTKSELLSMSVVDINPSMDFSDLNNLIKKLRENPSVLFETTHQKKNGDLVPVEALAKLISFDDEEYVISFVRDISDRHNK